MEENLMIIDDEINEQPKRKGEPFGSPSRSKPYTKRRHSRVTGNWNGIYNLMGLVFPEVKTRQDIHVALTNRVCENHAL